MVAGVAGRLLACHAKLQVEISQNDKKAKAKKTKAQIASEITLRKTAQYYM